MSRTSDAIVIGGGLHGLSAALQLARRGVSVLLLERSRVGRHSSGASAAGVRTLGRARAELPISLRAAKMWHDMEALVGDDCGFHAYGQLRVAENAEELAFLETAVGRLRADGFDHETLVGSDDLRDIAPALAPHCVGGIFTPRDGAADPHRTLSAFHRSARAAGVVVEEGVGVTGISRSDGVWSVTASERTFQSSMVVNAAGAWAGRIAALAGDVIPLETKASMMIVTERVAPFVRPTVSSAIRKLSFKQTDQGTILIGGGQQGRPDLENERAEVDAARLAASAAAALALFPSVGALRIVRSWAGLEAKTRDNVAVAGLSPSAPGLMHLFGFSGHGFQLVPALGVVAADLLLTGHTDIDVSGLAPARLMTCERASAAL